jgi:hypothetical protein
MSVVSKGEEKGERQLTASDLTLLMGLVEAVDFFFLWSSNEEGGRAKVSRS